MINNNGGEKSPPKITYRKTINTSYGTFDYIKINTIPYRNLTWEEIEEIFNKKYPGKWALQIFPPSNQILNGKPVYHLFVTDNLSEFNINGI